MATRNEFGVWEPSRYDELAAEFNAEIPDWEARLTQWDMRESGMAVSEDDFEIGQSNYIQVIRDWDAFLGMTSEWE